MRKKRLVSMALALILLLTACSHTDPDADTAPESVEPVTSESIDQVDDWSRTIAYVPLDDRPDNVERVVYLGKSAGYHIVFPDKALFSTRLDGQETSYTGMSHGDRAALLEWVRTADEAGCDLFLLSLDQLLSGGLVNSRAMSESEDIVFSDGTTRSELASIDEYLLSLGSDSENRIYVFDSLMRLASTVGYDDYDLAHYTAIRAYGNIERPSLTGDALTLNAIFECYPYSADGVTAAVLSVEDEASRALLTDEVVDGYLGARERKLRLLDHLLRGSKDMDGFYFLVGVDDSSNQSNIQSNEMAYLEQALVGRGLLVNGVDDLGMMLVARIAVDDTGAAISAYVEYFGGLADEPTTQFDHMTLRETVRYHIEALDGAETDDPAAADLQIIVLTAPDDETRTDEYADMLTRRLADNLAQGIPTVYIDASSNRYAKLNELLLERVPLGSLLGFSGYCDLAIIAGAGVSQGFARYAYLASAQEKAAEADQAFVQSLAIGMILATPYKATAKPALDSYIAELGLSSTNILGTAEQRKRIQEKLEQTLLPACEALCENLSESPVLSDLNGGTSGPYTVEVSDPYLPWSRTFEACFTINVD